MSSEILEEELDPHYEPSEKDIMEYAQFLGMDLDADQEFFYIAREGLRAKLPTGWKPCKSPEGDLYYFNFETGDTTWDHPCDAIYKKKFEDAKKNRIGQQRKKGRLKNVPKSKSVDSISKRPPKSKGLSTIVQPLDKPSEVSSTSIPSLDQSGVVEDVALSSPSSDIAMKVANFVEQEVDKDMPRLEKAIMETRKSSSTTSIPDDVDAELPATFVDVHGRNLGREEQLRRKEEAERRIEEEEKRGLEEEALRESERKRELERNEADKKRRDAENVLLYEEKLRIEKASQMKSQREEEKRRIEDELKKEEERWKEELRREQEKWRKDAEERRKREREDDERRRRTQEEEDRLWQQRREARLKQEEEDAKRRRELAEKEEEIHRKQREQQLK
ncbi:WW domain [Aduncisulcus paluster]|uniref:WW domain n=1 Tax=Aduncisulcus paluster TaxID=2918883 RepID=A0ABQ5KXK6_9EUKA|nr:WW domain [Aduncisulcus paluster]